MNKRKRRQIRRLSQSCEHLVRSWGLATRAHADDVAAGKRFARVVVWWIDVCECGARREANLSAGERINDAAWCVP